MAPLQWDLAAERQYEAGVDHGVLYIPDSNGAYIDGVSWNGLTAITEKPSGAEPTKKYADNIPYLTLISAEEFGATVEAITYPPEFAQFDGQITPTPGVTIGQQRRRSFGLCWRTIIGNAVDGNDAGYKLHMAYGCTAKPTEKAHNTVSDSPDTAAFSWDLSTQPVAVPPYRPTAILTVNSLEVLPETLADLETQLYGSVGVDPFLPLPATIIDMFESGVVEVVPVEPAFNAGTNTITIPAVAGITYINATDGNVPLVAGPLVIAHDTLVQATPNMGYILAPGYDSNWFYDYT